MQGLHYHCICMQNRTMHGRSLLFDTVVLVELLYLHKDVIWVKSPRSYGIQHNCLDSFCQEAGATEHNGLQDNINQ